MNLFKNLFAAIAVIALLISGFGCSQTSGKLSVSKNAEKVSISPVPVQENAALSAKIKAIVDELGYNVKYKTEDADDEIISITVMNLKGDKIEWGGLNPNKKSYPASAYKVFAAAEIYRRVAEGSLNWDDMILFEPNNNRGDDTVKNGEKYSLRYLVNTMLELSDNSCANQCIDIADRKKINDLLHNMGIKDSDVTRKYLPRKSEPEEYQKVPSTCGTSFDYAYFYAILGKEKFVNKTTSREFYEELCNSKRNHSINGGLPPAAKFGHKAGYYADFNIDAGLVKDGDKIYAIAIFFPEKTSTSNEKVHKIVKKIHELM